MNSKDSNFDNFDILTVSNKKLITFITAIDVKRIDLYLLSTK